MKKAILTCHAHEKIEERLLMSAEVLCGILDDDLVVTTGGESHSNRYHKVFYSPLNKMCFVAVQDCKTGHIITVLPMDYHQNKAWVISDDAQMMAKDIMHGHLKDKEEQKARQEFEKFQRIKQIQGRLAFRIYGYLEDEVKNIIDRTFICSWKDESLRADLGNLIEDDKFLAYLFDRLHKKRTSLEVNSNISIKRLSMQLGSKGEKTLFNIKALKYFNEMRKNNSC
jgi:hypothetical protein